MKIFNVYISELVISRDISWTIRVSMNQTSLKVGNAIYKMALLYENMFQFL